MASDFPDRPARSERTLRDAASEEGARAKPVDVLEVIFCGDRPTAGSFAVALAPGTPLVLGRGDTLMLSQPASNGELTLRLPDARVSQQHAILDQRRGGWVLEDLGSTNGTYLGGRRVTETPVQDGQLFAVGRTILRLRCRQKDALLGAPHEVPGAPELKTLSPAVWRLHDLLRRAAPTDVAVLLRGATGTGKEVAARALHQLSGRKGRFVAINCAALPENLLEAELFGFKRGAFSGATHDRQGLMAAAAEGTLFLDEVGDMPPAAQVKLLRVLQDQRVLPLGAPIGEGVRVSFRLVSATNASLDSLVAAGRFRPDLLARLRGFDLALVELKDRKMDLGSLVASLLVRHGAERASLVRFDRATAEAMVAYDYPFNVRELEQTLRALMALAGDDRVVELESLRETPVGRGLSAAETSTESALTEKAPSGEDAAERTRQALEVSLQRHRGNVSAVARELRCTRMQVHRWLKRWGIDLKSYRGGAP